MADLTREKAYKSGGFYEFNVRIPTQDNNHNYQGLIGTIDASGNVGNRTDGERVAGIFHESMDNTGTGHAAAKAGFDTIVSKGPWFELPVSGCAKTDIGKAVFAAADNQSFSFSPKAGHYMGTVMQYMRSGVVLAYCPAIGAENWNTWASLADEGDLTLPAANGIAIVSCEGEFAIVSVAAAGTCTALGATGGTGTHEQTAFINFGAPLAATTSAKATQYDLTGGNGSMAGIVNPDVPRNLVVNFTDGNAGITAFTLTATGTDQNGDAVVEVFTFSGGLDQVGSKIFATVTSIVLTNLAGAGAADTIDIGHGSKLGVPTNGASDLAVVHLAVDGAQEAAAACDQTYNSITATTALNGSKVVTAVVKYSLPITLTFTTTPGLSTNAICTDTDGYLCVWNDTGQPTISNRLGSTKKVGVLWIGAL